MDGEGEEGEEAEGKTGQGWGELREGKGRDILDNQASHSAFRGKSAQVPRSLSSALCPSGEWKEAPSLWSHESEDQGCAYTTVCKHPPTISLQNTMGLLQPSLCQAFTYTRV